MLASRAPRLPSYHGADRILSLAVYTQGCEAANLRDSLRSPVALQLFKF